MKFLYLSLVFLIVLGCGKATNPSDAAPSPAIDQLAKRVDGILKFAPVCDKVGEPYPSLTPNGDVNDCGDGDGVYMNGMLCLVGQTLSCDMVRDSIDDNGRPWRSPFRRQNGDTGINTFSRDQLNGLLMYLIATKDRDTATRFQFYIETHGNRMCPFDTDGRCNLTISSFGLLSKVYAYIDVTRPPDWVVASASLGPTLQLEAKTVSTGYALFLVGQELLILIRTGDYSLTAAGVADILFQRQPNNPFYRYLSKGADLETINLALSQAPIQPTAGTQWAIARDTAEQAWLASAGWDYVFLYNLFIGGGR